MIDFPSERVTNTLRLGRQQLMAARLPLEPEGVGVAVEQHRWAWKPREVRVLLIAESHVFTSPEDFTARIRRDLLPTDAQAAPLDYVRLIYCLGYGESAVIDRPLTTRNSGTPQFWNIFGRIARTGRQPTTLEGSWQQRIAWKVRTLRAMQDAGIWLVDASLHGVYAPGASRVEATVIQKLHAIWWRHYGEWITDQYPDAYRCIIGRSVARVLDGLGVRFDGWIYQPQARPTSGIDLEAGWERLLQAVRSS